MQGGLYIAIRQTCKTFASRVESACSGLCDIWLLPRFGCCCRSRTSRCGRYSLTAPLAWMLVGCTRLQRGIDRRTESNPLTPWPTWSGTGSRNMERKRCLVKTLSFLLVDLPCAYGPFATRRNERLASAEAVPYPSLGVSPTASVRGPVRAIRVACRRRFRRIRKTAWQRRRPSVRPMPISWLVLL